MKIELFSQRSPGGWSVPTFPDLDGERTLVLVFGGAGPAIQEPLQTLCAAYPKAHMLGCSTAGEIFGQSIFDDSLVVAVCRFDATPLRSISHTITSMAESFAVGATLGARLAAPDLRGVFVLSDGMNVNGSELVRGLISTLSADVLVTGGLAADGDRFQKTWVIAERRPTSGMVSAIGFYGDHIVLGDGSKGGWDVFGPERRVTRSEGNVLFELDGVSALALYKRYLGELASGLPATGLLFPLRLRRRMATTGGIVRTILSIDEKAGSITFAGDIPEGSWGQLMRANLDRLIDGAADAAQAAKLMQATTQDSLAIAISCVGRRLVLVDRAEEELEAVIGILPATSRLIGFYSYGEISPSEDGPCDLHNQTMTLTMLAER